MSDKKKEKPKIVDHVDNLQEILEQIQGDMFAFYDEGFHAGIQKLVAEGKIKKREGEAGYDLSVLEKDKDARQIMVDAINGHAEDWMKHLYSDFSKWSEDRKEAEKMSKLGLNRYTIEQAVNVYREKFSAGLHRKIHEKSMAQVIDHRKDALYCKIKGKDAQDIFEHCLGYERDGAEWKKINWKVFERDDNQLRHAVENYQQHGKHAKPYLRQALWYNN